MSKSKGRRVDGILLLDKPAGMTSNGALQRAKHLYGTAKAGHTGSLDPLATGMLPLCFGAATRVSGYLLAASKTYVVTGRFGIATDTGDSDGKVCERADGPVIEESALTAVLEQFRGTSEQIPPMYSALKHRGQPLYSLARKGIDVEREPREITVHSIALRNCRWPEFTFMTCCSKGTYVRTLVGDIAAQLGTLAHVTALRRLEIGPFAGLEMHDFATLKEAACDGLDALDRLLLPIDRALPDWPSLELSHDIETDLRHGRPVAAELSWAPGRVRLYGPTTGFFGLGEVRADGRLVPRRIIPL